MNPRRIIGSLVMLTALGLGLLATSCFSGTSGNSSTVSPTPDVLKPKPTVISSSANYSGTADGYYVTLDINIKNEGSEGTVLVQATVTQAGKSTTNEMPVFVKKGATGETKMTFPLVWKGGEATYTIKAVTP
jgi:hypothetical protein